MRPALLPERDRRGCEAAFNHGQSGNGNTALQMAIATALGIVGIASLATEWVIGYRVFSDVFAPDVPGEAAHGPAALMAFGTALASAAFHIYLAKQPDALAGKLLNKCVPWLVLTFIAGMGLMATRTVLGAADIPLFGSEALPPDLFAEQTVPTATSLFDRIAIGMFGIGLAGLAVSNFWLTQKIADFLLSRIKGLADRRALARKTRFLMDAINADEARLLRLSAEQQALLRELEPQASLSFANELAGVVQQLRGPVTDIITGSHIWKKRPESVIERKEEAELDLAKFKELVASLDLKPEQIFAAFNGSHEVRKK